MNNKIKVIISWGLVILWMGIIFNFSNMDTDESNTKSKDTIEKVVDTTIDTSNKIGITKDDVSDDKIEGIVSILNKPLRKCMHAAEYLVLSLLLIIALNVSKKKIFYKYLIAIIICFIYACTDEYHQLFISGRTGQFTDVLIDTFGAIVGIIIYNIMSNLIRKYKLIYNKNNSGK